MTTPTVSNVVLHAHTALFAQRLCQTISDMAGSSYTVAAETLSKGFFSYEGGGFICFTHFAGRIQGDYIIAMHSATAAALAGIMVDAWTDKEIRRARETFSGFVKEMLNISVHQVIVELEKTYGALTLVPPTAVYGEMESPGITSGTVEIDGEPGVVQCTVSLNMTSLKMYALENSVITN